jgi:hypothetical protein
MKSKSALQPVAAGVPLGLGIAHAAYATVAESFWRHRVLVALVGGYAVACYAVALASGQVDGLRPFYLLHFLNHSNRRGRARL